MILVLKEFKVHKVHKVKYHFESKIWFKNLMHVWIFKNIKGIKGADGIAGPEGPQVKSENIITYIALLQRREQFIASFCGIDLLKSSCTQRLCTNLKYSLSHLNTAFTRIIPLQKLRGDGWDTMKIGIDSLLSFSC